MYVFCRCHPGAVRVDHFPGKPAYRFVRQTYDLFRVAERAALSSATRVIVATDDARISNACRAVVWMLR